VGQRVGPAADAPFLMFPKEAKDHPNGLSSAPI
jgi:hypothetical protein